MTMFIYFDLLAIILDEPKSTKHGWNFFVVIEYSLGMLCLFLFKGSKRLFENSEKLFSAVRQ
jgi:hypothetical protein